MKPSDFISIRNDKPFKGEAPEPLELPIHHSDPVPWSEVKTVKTGDSDYEESLVRWMFLNGYIQPGAFDAEIEGAK